MSLFLPEETSEEMNIGTTGEVLLLAACTVIGMALFVFILIVTALAPGVGVLLYGGCAILFVLILVGGVAASFVDVEESD